MGLVVDAVAAIYAFFLAVPALLIAFWLKGKFAWLPLVLLVLLVILIDQQLYLGVAPGADTTKIGFGRLIGMAAFSLTGVFAAAVPTLLFRWLFHMVRGAFGRAGRDRLEPRA